jgi:KaiC/GvpD/RAD55 family RecA-like ATPase
MPESTELLFPQLFGFESLFGLRLFEKAEGKGLRPGSTVLFEGAPGAGKTAMAMAICRALMAKDTNMRLFYISGENNGYDLKRKLSQFGWFDKKDPEHGKNAGEDNGGHTEQGNNRTRDKINRPEKAEKEVSQLECSGFWGDDEPLAGPRCFFANLPQRGPNRPVPSSEQLVNNAFAQIRNVYRTGRGKCIVVVDSITGLTRDSSVDAEKRRLADDLIDVTVHSVVSFAE